jgi:aspartate/tyrosine/aromatic aminotransferase
MYADECMDRCVFMYVCVHACMYVWMDGWMDEWMDGYQPRIDCGIYRRIAAKGVSGFFLARSDSVSFSAFFRRVGEASILSNRKYTRQGHTYRLDKAIRTVVERSHRR